MKKQILLSLIMNFVTLTSFSICVSAAPRIMNDGTMFDAEFYADRYPDVATIYGSDEARLYEHYVQFGNAEGRLPFATTTNATSVSNDLVVGNIDETAEKQAQMQEGYYALPQNVRNFYNSKNIMIYACTRNHIGTVNTRKSIGFTRSCWTDEGFSSATIYVCGSQYMPPKYTLYHELGHVLDYDGRYSSNWDGWAEMQPYNKTQVYSAREAFAEAFAGYFDRNEKLKKTAPNAYAYIEDIIVNM